MPLLHIFSDELCWSVQTRLRRDIPRIPECWDYAAVLWNLSADWLGRVGRIRDRRLIMIRSCWSGRPDDWSGGLGCLERKLSWPGWESRDNVLFHMLSLLALGPALLHSIPHSGSIVWGVLPSLLVQWQIINLICIQLWWWVPSVCPKTRNMVKTNRDSG